MNTAAEMTAMMRTVITNGTGRAANIGKPAAGKTGTTDDNKDAYFVGYTPHIVAGVWVGNDDNTVITKGVQGGTVPALIWRDMMKVATEPYGKAEFNYPEVKLMPFAAGSNVKIIGEEEEAQETTEQATNNSNTLDEQTAQTAQEAVQNVVKTINAGKKAEPVKQQQPTPLPAAKPVVPSKPASAPIPMAVPDSLH